jgi:hypothetical protein
MNTILAVESNPGNPKRQKGLPKGRNSPNTVSRSNEVMTQINPYLRFDGGKCREAMSFYKECLGGNLQVTTLRETPVASQLPKEIQDQVMHANLSTEA